MPEHIQSQQDRPAADPAKGGTPAAQPSGPKGDNPATAGPGPTAVHSQTPENDTGRLNPSAPEDSNTTPGSGADK